jgi:hypothetical protein
MSDYLKGVIYKLHNDDITEIYIGSTADKKQRKKQHKSDCNNEYSEEYNRKVYKFIRNNGGWDNWKFEVIERFPCENEIQLRIRERYHYDLLKPELNMIRPFITKEELKKYQAKWRKEHKKVILKNSAKRYQDNREEIQKQHAINYQEHREERQKQHAINYQEHREERRKQHAINYKANQEEIRKRHAINREKNREKQNQKHNCECGNEYRFCDKIRHCKSNKHIAFLKTINNV